MKPTNVYGWDGFELISGDVSVGITPSIGGRIMSLKFQGHEFLFYDASRAGQTYQLERWQDLDKAKKELGFCVWGGDKTWIAPQSAWLRGIPPLDLDASSYEISWAQDEAVMTSPVCRETGVQIIRKVRLYHHDVYLSETIYNRSIVPVKKGLWNVTQVARPCHFSIPAVNDSFRDYHSEDATLPPYKGSLLSKNGMIDISCTKEELFKVGGNPLKGEVFIYIDRDNKSFCWKKNFDYFQDRSYAHGSAVEVFNSSIYPYAEIELHAPFSEILPNSAVSFKQHWQISACPSKS